MAKIVLVDLPNAFRRHAHVAENRPEHQPLRATLGDVRTWAEEADFLACAIDSPPYVRSELYPEYKANRERAPDWMHELLRDTVQRLRDDGFPVLAAAGLEADDVIATAVHQLRDGDHEITIVSGDKDVLQLVGDRVRVYQPMTSKLLDRDAVVEKYGVEPSQMVDWIAMVGDKSDNLPGVPGVGDDTATKLLGQYGDIDGILHSLEALTEKKRAAFVATRTTLLTTRVLVRLRTDAPVDASQILVKREAKPPQVQVEPETEEDPRVTVHEAPKPKPAQEPRRSLKIVGQHGGIKGIQPSLAEAGKIKIGGLGEERTSKSGKKFRLPVKLDHFIITKTNRDEDGDLELDEELMAELPKSADGHVREIPIVVHSDEIDEVFPTAYALYYGKKLSCRGDGETATRWEMDRQGNRTGKSAQRRCPCDYLDAKGGTQCKPHGTLHCSIAVPGRSVAGAVHRWRTTSIISIRRMIGSLLQIKATCGTMRGLPLVLRVEPVSVQPPGERASTVYCCHVELRAQNLMAVQRQALQLAQMRRAVAGDLDNAAAYRALIQPPATGESPEEEAEIAAEFYPDARDFMEAEEDAR